MKLFLKQECQSMADVKNFYKLGKQYASRPFDDPLFEDIPPMNWEERQAFNRGYDDALNSPNIGPKMFVFALVAIVVMAIVSFVK